MNYFTHTLENGLRIIHQQTNSPITYCGFIIDVGTRDEAVDEEGMAHLVEHLIFKGTKKRRAWHIINRMENVGGELNAYTTKEETVVYSAFLSMYFLRGLELLVDIIFNSTFPEEELKREVEVVIDEIESYKDSPAELIYDEFESLIFKNHPLGRDILGTPEKLRTYTSKDILKFVRKYYVPNNMAFFVRGNISSKRVVNALSKYMSGIDAQPLNLLRLEPSTTCCEYLAHERGTHQAHVVIGGRAFDYFDNRRMALILLNNILGGPGMNSRLNISLREKKGMVYGVDSTLTSYSDSGVFFIYYGVSREDLKESIELVNKELEDLRNRSLSSLKLSVAKKQLIGQIGISSDNSESLSLGMARTYLRLNHCLSFEDICQEISKITAIQLQEVAQELFDESNLSTLIYK